MPRGGSKPGERRGGRGPNTPNKPKIDAANRQLLISADAAMRQTPPHKKRGREILEEWANYFGGLATRFQPSVDDGKPKWASDRERDLFLLLAHRSCLYAHWVAPYQDPTYKAIVIAPETTAKPGDDARLIDLKIFDSVAEAVRDEVVSED